VSIGARENEVAAAARQALLGVLQEHYTSFIPFLHEVMDLLGFKTSDIQEDIADFMVHGPEALMVQAQRSQAKTTIAAAFCVWSLIHDPTHRILVISAGGTQANEISTLIVRIIMSMDVLECIRPDKRAGDRTSVESFDVHHSLKGVDKSPSVACIGIGANMQGKRATILLADDVESSKNSLTATMREQLLHLTLDFTSICTGGRIIWLGTPQTSESIYNTLPARGVTVRIWPGRYPNEKQLAHYGPHLAPLLTSRMALNPTLRTGGGLRGDQGQPIDPSYLGETVLQKKELDQGEAYFALQHMLNTRLLDATRHPLRVEKIQTIRLDKSRKVPISLAPSFTPMGLRTFAYGHRTFQLSIPTVSPSWVTVPALKMYIDPAAGGANGDETAWAIGGESTGNIYVFDFGGMPGGYALDKMEALAAKALEWGVEEVIIEKNMGYGAFREVLTPVLKRVHPLCGLDDDMVHGQKETRINATLGPIMGRGALIINTEAIEAEWGSVQAYGTNGIIYTLLHQLDKLTLARGALVHDDRADCLEGLCRKLQANLVKDQEKAQKAADRRAYEEMTKDPLGRNNFKPPGSRSHGMANRFRR
jgi:hypothetical protein